MNITKLTFTGIDNASRCENLNALSERYGFIEWGMLYSPSSSGVNCRYPGVGTVQKFIDGLVGNVALHLCGKGVREFSSGSGAGYELARSVIHKGGRVQLNVNYGSITNAYKEEIARAISDNSDGIFILQMNDNNVEAMGRFKDLHNYSFLFDSSGGRGESPTHGWPPMPINGVRCGYAGGLGPENLKNEIETISMVANGYDIWLDMESKIRSLDQTTTEDYLDITKCIICANIVEEYNAND